MTYTLGVLVGFGLATLLFSVALRWASSVLSAENHPLGRGTFRSRMTSLLPPMVAFAVVSVAIAMLARSLWGQFGDALSGVLLVVYVLGPFFLFFVSKPTNSQAARGKR